MYPFYLQKRDYLIQTFLYFAVFHLIVYLGEFFILAHTELAHALYKKQQKKVCVFFWLDVLKFI